MKTYTIAFAAFVLAACATAEGPDYSKTPPEPGADIYRCANGDGKPYFVRVKAGLHQTWRGTEWGPNSCDDARNRCKADESGLIVVERTLILPESKMRVDMLDIFNLKAGTNLNSIALNGDAITPIRDTCTPHA